MTWEERIGRRITLRDLHIVLAVVEAGSMAGAADRQSTSHPVISRTVSELEAVLGYRLFDRGVRGVVPTIYGDALAKCAISVFDELRLGLRRIEFLADPDTGTLSLACPEAMAAGFVQAVTEGFMQEHPDVRVDVLQTGTVTSGFDELRKREIELLIGRLPLTTSSDDVVAEPLFQENMLVVTGSASKWSRRRRVELSELVDEPWVLPPAGSIPGQICVALFASCGMAFPRAKMETLSIHLQQTLVADGTCLTLLPRSLLHFAGKRLGLTAVKVNAPPQQSPVGIITLRNRTLSPLAQRFIDHVRIAAAPLTANK